MTRRTLWPHLIGLLTIYALAALVEPADAGELYASGGFAWQVPHGRCTGNGVCRWDRTEPDPLLGHLELGYSIGKGRWLAALYARHESQPTRFDFGVNSIGVAARVTLWRHNGH